MSDVAAPSQAEWWDADLALTNVLHRLRLTDADIDSDRIVELIPVAGRLVNDELDAVLDVAIDPTLQQAVETVTIDLYLYSPDPLVNARVLIGSSRERFGVA
jgi:hypothetical protein